MKYVRKLGYAVPLLVAAGVAHAEVPAAVTSKLAEAAVDAAAVGAGIILIVLAVKAVKWLRSAL
ncbi:Methyltransferase [Cupriavidus oxalaticus]|uniref:major capsid protein n=1 Tax=Cupriavidus oxalaticus TaxID=96344 RepID=UPI003F73E1DC